MSAGREEIPVPHPRAILFLPFYLGFAATGIGVSLPGAILPVLLTRWRLEDQGGGTLFFLAWLASSVGALLLSASLLRTVALGSCSVALGSLELAFCPASFANLSISLFGLGLGMTMTAVSLLLQRHTATSGKVLVRLNLLWAIGAASCPIIALHTLRTANIGALLFPVAGVFALLAGWSIFLEFREGEIKRERQASPALFDSAAFGHFFRAMPASLIALVMLTTGVEASAGGWLATYASRGGDPLSQMVAAPVCLWMGLLLSRLFWSFSARIHAERWVLQGSLLLMSGSALMLLISRHGVPFFVAAGCLGFGLGPAYPLLLARALRIHASGTIFFLAGFGAACLPWLTGFVSSQFGSLHAGFFVPATACLLMLTLSFTGVLGAGQSDSAA